MNALTTPIVRLVAALAASLMALPAPAQVTSTPLYALVQSMPENSWAKANQNGFNEVWVPEALAPLFENSFVQPATKIIESWSSFAWDSRRGDLILWGGGHMAYPGNEVYRWRSSTLRWERASLPSEIEFQRWPVWHAIDGPDAAPTSAHTYDNNAYLPLADRFLTFGGATYQDGTVFTKYTDASETVLRRTGPYLWDPSRADGNRVGGTTGSHVQRVAPYPGVLGGNMWQNRDLAGAIGALEPHDHVDSCVQVAFENGRETVYLGGRSNGASAMHLYKWTLGATAQDDTFEQVGALWDSVGGQTTCGYWSQRKLFVYTFGGARPLYFWDLTHPGPTNYHQAVDPSSLTTLISDLAARNLDINKCALKFDPNRENFVLWCGDAALWRIVPPATNVPTGWSVQRIQGGGTPPVTSIDTGIMGKWKHAPDYDVFVGLMHSFDGSVWIYKPAGWRDPGPAPANQPPVVAPTAAPASARVGAPIAFNANATDSDGTIAAIAWTFGDGQTASGASVTRSFSQAGAYSVAVVATDDDGATGSGSLLVTITANAPPTVTASATPSSAPVGAAILFTATASDSDGTVASIVWTFTDGTTMSGASVTHAFAQPGTYAANVTVTDNDGATAARTVSVLVTANAPPTVTASAAPSSAPVGAAILFTATASDSDGTVASIVWTFSDGTTMSGASVTHTFAQPGTYAANVTVTDNDGGSAMRTVLVTVTANAAPAVAVTATPATAGVGVPIVFTANAADADGSIASITWTFSDGTTASGASVSKAFASAGSHTATAVATDNLGATASASVAVTITTLPPTVTANANPSTPATWEPVAFVASASDSDGFITAIRWDFGDGHTASGQNVMHAYATPGTFVATVTVTDNDGATSTASTTIAVSDPLPQQTVTVVLQQGHLGYAGTSDTFLDRQRPDDPRAAEAVLQVNRDEQGGLLRFAIFASEGGPVPDGATITSARLSVYKLVEVDPAYALHAVLVPWVAGEATWNVRSAGTPWTMPGGFGAGSDIADDWDALGSGPATLSWVTFDVSARVKTWSGLAARGVAANRGWRLAHFSRNGPRSEIASSKASDPALRPRLEIEFHRR